MNNFFQLFAGARKNASNLVVVITDGQSTHPTQTAAEAALLKNETTVIAIGKGLPFTRTFPIVKVKDILPRSFKIAIGKKISPKYLYRYLH